MAAALQCEICGGKLVGKPGGIFECDSCGMEYSTEWAKAKIQEIKGTVKVEGTVEVTGKVTVDGPVKVEGGINVDGLLKRGQMALADKDWDKAEEIFEEALKIDSERADCHFGLLCSKFRCPDLDSLLSTKYKKLKTDKDFLRAVSFADSETRNRIAQVERDFSASQAAYELESIQKAQEMQRIRARLKPVQHLICCTDKLVAAIKTDGTLLIKLKDHLDRFEKEMYDKVCAELRKWEDIVSLSASFQNIIGLKSDGTVVAVSVYDSDNDVIGISKWKDIIAIDASDRRVLGLKKDGTVIAVGKDYRPDPLTHITKCDLSNWQNIAAISHIGDTDIGIRTDGTFVPGIVAYRDREKIKRISEWKNLVSLSEDDYSYLSMGLCSDGTILELNGEHYAQGIVQLYPSKINHYALDTNGNVLKYRGRGVFENYLMGENIVAVVSQGVDLICLKADGTVLRRTNYRIEPLFSGQKLFENLETIEQERKQIAEEKAHRIEAKKAEDYETALNLSITPGSIDNIEKAIRLFSLLGDYKDSAENLVKCRIKKEELQKDAQYTSACVLMRENRISSVGKAQQEFKNLGAWKDSKEKVRECIQKIQTLKAVDKLEQQKRDLETQRANLRGLFTGKQRREIEAQLAEIDSKLKELN